MNVLTAWLRSFLPPLPVSDRQLADDLTLRGIAVEGVHALPATAAGEPLGHLFETDITTNRVDAMNHYGIAREVATMYGLPLAPLRASFPPEVGLSIGGGEVLPVRIAPEAEGMCGRFTARVLRGVRIAPSVDVAGGRVSTWFEALGAKRISNAVDASNFTLLGMGHPTHAFDLAKVEGGIVVRLARAGEMLRLLDGSTVTLEADDLVIADERKALSLAGVMGGMESSITAETRDVLVESAWFDPAAVRRSARRHGLHTDASHRFERGADFAAAPLANDLVSALILESAGGRLASELVDVVVPAAEARTAARPEIALRVSAVQAVLGRTTEDRDGASALTAELVARTLRALGCDLVEAGVGRYAVRLPSWRLDLEREIDLIEEVARVFGYNRFANTLPTPMPVRERPEAAAERAVRGRLLALGFTEMLSSTFCSAEDAAVFAAVGGGMAVHGVPMENPLSEEASLLRPSLLPGMLSAVAANLHRDVREARLFEQGHTFVSSTAVETGEVAEVVEQPELALGLTTGQARGTGLLSAEDAPIYALKGAVESLAGLFALPGGAESLAMRADGLPGWMEPGRGGVATLHGVPLAAFGELNRAEAARRKLRQPVYLAGVRVGELLRLPLREHTAREVSRYQAVDRDFSFIFPDGTEWHTVRAAVQALALPDLERLEPVEIFRDATGKAVAAGHYSLLLRATFQSGTRTLTEGDLAGASEHLAEALRALGGVQRA